MIVCSRLQWVLLLCFPVMDLVSGSIILLPLLGHVGAAARLVLSGTGPFIFPPLSC